MHFIFLDGSLGKSVFGSVDITALNIYKMSDCIEKSANFYRIISLVVDVGTETLRDIFYHKVPKSYVAKFFATPDLQKEFRKLKGKPLTEAQYAKVTKDPDPDTYDISLLTTLLTNNKICGISKPKEGWGKTPDSSDTSLGADLLRLREIRNEIIAHSSKVQLEGTDFKKIWGNVEVVLVRIAGHIGRSEEDKVKKKIKDAETRKLEPLQDNEKKLLQEFINWQKEDNKKFEEQLTDLSTTLKKLDIKVDSLKPTIDEADAARSSISSEDALSCLQSQMTSLAESVGSIAKKDDVEKIQDNMRKMEDSVKSITELVRMLKTMVEKSNRDLEELSKNAPTSGYQPMSTFYDRGQSRTYVPERQKKPKLTNPNAMTNKEIQDLSKKIGYEWESLRIHLDFTEAQGHALKWAFNDNVKDRIYQMLKRWHDVVVDCGENPKMLLAAAFVNASTNYAMAHSIVPKQQFDANAQAKPETVEHIQEITFSRSGHDHGDMIYDRRESRASCQPAGPPGGPSTFNVYGGDVKIEGLGIHHSYSSSSDMSSDNPDGSTSQFKSLSSFNIYDGKVAISKVNMGTPTQTSFFQSYNQMPTVRGEMPSIVPDFCKPQQGSFPYSGQPFKKENDDTLSQSMVDTLGGQMKSVGALISRGEVIGTVFRVGSKFVMTALHVVTAIIDPHRTGNADVNLLESDDTFINFNESVVSPGVRVYKVRKEYCGNKELDIAVLEISDQTLSDLPMKLNLCMNDVNEVQVTSVSLVGYGHPSGRLKKHLDHKCKIVPSSSDRMRTAQAFSQQYCDFFRSVIQENGGNPDLVNKGYLGYDNPSKLLFDCFMEYGASGGPALSNNNERSVQVVGLLTHGLPEFFFCLPDFVKPNFPNVHRLEAGTKMNYIYEWMKTTQEEHIVKDIFNL